MGKEVRIYTSFGVPTLVPILLSLWEGVSFNNDWFGDFSEVRMRYIKYVTLGDVMFCGDV